MKALLFKYVVKLAIIMLGIVCYVVIFTIGCNKTDPTLKPTDSTEKDTLEPPIISVDSLLGTWWCCTKYQKRPTWTDDLPEQARTMVNITFVSDSVIKFDIGANYNAGHLWYHISGDRFLFTYVFSDTQNEEYYDYDVLQGYARKLSCSSSFSYVNGHLHIDSIPTIPVYRDLTFTRFDTTNSYASPQEYLGEWIFEWKDHVRDSTGDFKLDTLLLSCVISKDTILFPDYPWCGDAYYYRFCADSIIYLKRLRESDMFADDITYMYLNEDKSLVIGGIKGPEYITFLPYYDEIKLRRP